MKSEKRNKSTRQADSPQAGTTDWLINKGAGVAALFGGLEAAEVFASISGKKRARIDPLNDQPPLHPPKVIHAEAARWDGDSVDLPPITERYRPKRRHRIIRRLGIVLTTLAGMMVSGTRTTWDGIASWIGPEARITLTVRQHLPAAEPLLYHAHAVTLALHDVFSINGKVDLRKENLHHKKTNYFGKNKYLDSAARMFDQLADLFREERLDLERRRRRRKKDPRNAPPPDPDKNRDSVATDANPAYQPSTSILPKWQRNNGLKYAARPSLLATAEVREPLLLAAMDSLVVKAIRADNAPQIKQAKPARSRVTALCRDAREIDAGLARHGDNRELYLRTLFQTAVPAHLAGTRGERLFKQLRRQFLRRDKASYAAHKPQSRSTLLADHALWLVPWEIQARSYHNGHAGGRS